MSSEIRPGGAPVSPATQANAAEFTIQNPLFNLGGHDPFPQVLQQQVSARQDSRPGSSVALHRESRSVRQDRQADDRQSGGKRLPERAEEGAVRSSSRHPRAEKAVDTEPSRTESTTHASDQISADASSQQNQASPQQTVSSDSVQTQVADGGSPGLAGEQPLIIAAANDVAVTDEVPDAALDPALQDSGAGSVEVAAAEEQQTDALLSQESAQPSTGNESQLLQQEGEGQELDLVLDVDAEPIEADVPVEADNTAVATPVQGDDLLSDPALAAPVSDPVVAQAATPPVAPLHQSAADARLTEGAVSRQKSASAFVPAEPATQQDLLAADAKPADRNAESRAEFSKLMAAMPDRGAQFKEQLAALAQQVGGNGTQAQKKVDADKAGAVIDSKSTPFSRSLEQLNTVRSEGGKAVSTGIHTPVYSRAWSSELGQRLVMMVSSKLKSAEIHLNPKDLGPMEVRIRMHEDKAHVVFSSQVPQTREALEQAVPRLREMLDQNGVALGNVDVQDHGTRHSGDQGQRGDGRRDRAGGDAEADTVSENGSNQRQLLGVVDYYA